MLLLATLLLAHAEDAAAPAIAASERAAPEADDLIHGRRYTRARYLDLPSGDSADGRVLPAGTTPLHTEPLAHVPARNLRALLTLVPGALPTRDGVRFSDGGTPALYLDGVRWDSR